MKQSQGDPAKKQDCFAMLAKTAVRLVVVATALSKLKAEARRPNLYRIAVTQQLLGDRLTINQH